MSRLMSIFEMRERYQKKEDPFDLTVEKWIRIRQFLDTASTLSDFKKLLQASTIPVPFCFQYQEKNCLNCPLEKICGRGEGEKFVRVVRLIQAYVFGGDMLPKGPLISEIDNFLTELELLKAKSKGRIH